MDEGVFIVGFLVLGVYKTFELFVRKKERLAIIEKFTSLNFESAKPVRLPSILFEKQDSGSWPLRISLLLTGIGLGSICASLFRVYFGNMGEEITFTQDLGSITLFGGLGLFIAFLIELKQKNKQSDGDNT